MSVRDAELKEALRQLVEPAMEGLGGHPEPVEILAYHAGELPPSEDARLRQHLVLCGECQALLLEVESFQPTAGPAGEEAVAAWEELATRLRTPPHAPRLGGWQAPPPPRWPYALAASFLVAALGLGSWAWSLRQTVSELSRPQLDAPILDLHPTAQRGGSGPHNVLALPPQTRLFTLILNLGERPGHASYRVEIVRAGGRLQWQGGELTPNRHGSMTLTLSRYLLAGPGDYRVRLYGLGGGARELVEEYPLVIEDR